MANGNKNESAGATAPATPSTVEGTRSIESLTAENTELKARLDLKNQELADSKSEFEAFKTELKPKVEALVAENTELKAKLSTGVNGVKKYKNGSPVFIVVSAFRGNEKGEGVFAIGDDVSHFKSDRLEKLVEQELVKEVQ